MLSRSENMVSSSRDMRRSSLLSSVSKSIAGCSEFLCMSMWVSDEQSESSNEMLTRRAWVITSTHDTGSSTGPWVSDRLKGCSERLSL